ncbi:hypothetical protein VB834_09280 [Limnoraphis robusta Tam1]|uniref:DUF3987 domain-containing protein n=1 Tax=Limnoraphis robusta CCNP1315 TaxID=3110306 RepID=A0ABU5TY46_9CYAN|nr:hypothetical protein [Limnoraphis robusta]MEA5500357.1 hypothetical protein [Limnoraphis robusta BA-68 BA1]MEA5519561.1 hypothetical protein [Limnoraphis robusta CCNP1315]MEA5539225.1 hypothetical protein [Limnoraphis robusta Tam1]MEA5545829.1 hypothetical protein [Limnoraphis robusta CCNP1324]
MSEKFLDYSQFRDSFLIDWREVVPNDSDSLWDNLSLLFDACFLLPHNELQRDLILATILTPSAIATNLPITFLWGESGSGKSKVGSLASKLYGVQPLLENSTTASIRNTLNDRKYLVHPDMPEERLERNTILCWDDIRPVRISPNSPDSIFGILKSGCNRATSKTRIALPGAKIQEFCTFGTKIISSIHTHWSIPGCEELKRRAMIFHFKKNETDREYVDPDLLDVTELEIDLKLFYRTDICLEYQAIKRGINKHKTSSKHREFKTMILDVLTTLALHKQLKVNEVIDEYLIPYQELVRLPLLEKSITIEILSQFVEEKTLATLTQNKLFLEDGMEQFIETELRITSQEALDFLKKRILDGSLDLPRLDNLTIHQLMINQGFKPQSTKQGLIWVKPL